MNTKMTGFQWFSKIFTLVWFGWKWPRHWRGWRRNRITWLPGWQKIEQLSKKRVPQELTPCRRNMITQLPGSYETVQLSKKGVPQVQNSVALEEKGAPYRRRYLDNFQNHQMCAYPIEKSISWRPRVRELSQRSFESITIYNAHMVWWIWKYLDRNAIFCKIFDWKLLISRS